MNDRIRRRAWRDSRAFWYGLMDHSGQPLGAARVRSDLGAIN